jgi:hypothetical protein
LAVAAVKPTTSAPAPTPAPASARPAATGPAPLRERERYRDHDREDESDNERDDRDDGQTGKKRKVPSSMQALGRQDVLDNRCHHPDHADCDERHLSHHHTHAEHEHGDGAGGADGDGDCAGNGEGEGDRNQGGVDGDGGDARYPNSTFLRRNGRWTSADPPRSQAAKACSWRKALFLRRKAALITLFLDAQTAINSALNTKGPVGGGSGAGAGAGSNAGTAAKAGGASGAASKTAPKPKVILPEVAVFEQMMPALEDVGVGQWPLDQPGWRTGVEMRDETAVHVERWRKGYERRRREREGREEERGKVKRSGWVPEGSFEFEMASKCEWALRFGWRGAERGHEDERNTSSRRARRT